MALTLVMVAQFFFTIVLIPVSDQHLWLGEFVSWSFYWVLMTVVQYVLVGVLYYICMDQQAKKESKHLELMNSNARGSMMLQAAAEHDADAAEAAEEQMLLTHHHEREQNIPPETLSLPSDNSPLSHSSPKKDRAAAGHDAEAVEAPEEQKSLTQQHDKAQNIPPASISSPQKDSWLYTFSLRKLDALFFVFAVVTYTNFIVVMSMTSSTNIWLRNEPNWLDEEGWGDEED